MASALLASWAQAANIPLTVVNGQTDLTSSSTYSPAVTPTATNDVVFSGTYSPAAFTLNSSLTIGSLNDLSATALDHLRDIGNPHSHPRRRWH